MTKKTSLLFIFFLALALMPISVPRAFAQEGGEATPFKSTPYPVPRYISTGADEVYVRTGPGKKYPIKWVYKKKGLPVEVILEYENWRKVKDWDGEDGWVHSSLLSGKRTGIITAKKIINLYANPEEGSRVRAHIEPSALVHVEECDGAWCKINAAGYDGWIRQSLIWGVYEREIFD